MSHAQAARHHQPRLHLMSLFFFVALAFLILNPIILFTGSKVGGFDFFNYHWNYWWMRHALVNGLAIYETNNVFAHTLQLNNLGYHALTPFWFPLWAALEPAIGTLWAMTIIITAGCVLNGYLSFVFFRREGIAPGLALLGGAVMQATPLIRYFYYNTHINLMDWFWLPASLMLAQELARAAAQQSVGRLVGWGLAFGAALWGLTLTDHQFPIFVAFLLAPYSLHLLWRSPAKMWLIAGGAVALIVGAGLLWIAGPLPYALRFEGELAPGDVRERPGIPFPCGYFQVNCAGTVWWNWNVPTLGGFVTVAVMVTLVFALLRQVRGVSKAIAEQSRTRMGGYTGADALIRPYNGFAISPPRSKAGATTGAASTTWLWFGLLLPPLILTMGPQISVFGAEIPMPFRILYDQTNGMFKMPWRLAPIYLFAAMCFVGLSWSHALPRRTGPRIAILAGLFLLLAADARIYQTAPLEDSPRRYRFYEAMRTETEDYVVLEVPTGVGTGEVLIGDPRAIQLQFYTLTHEKRTVNGFISRAPVESFWPLRTDDPMLSWLGQRRDLDAAFVEDQLRERIPLWPIGYVVVHQDLIGRTGATVQEIIGYLNRLDDLLCPVWVEGEAVVYRTSWHPAGCPERTPDESAPGVYTIDIGSPGDERFIGWGWHWPEEVAGLTLRWAGEYPQTDVYLDLPPGTYNGEIIAQAFWEPRRLQLLLNEEPVSPEWTIEPGSLQTFAFTLPAEMVGDGQHVKLSLAYDTVVVPSEVGQSADPRPLSIAVDRLTFNRLSEGP
jgi:hypothetical protein